MTDDVLGPELAECPLCGCIGLKERVCPENHDCAFFDEQRRHYEDSKNAE